MATRHPLQFDDLTIGDTLQIKTVDGQDVTGVFCGFVKEREGHYVTVLMQTPPDGTATVYCHTYTGHITRVKLIHGSCADRP